MTALRLQVEPWAGKSPLSAYLGAIAATFLKGPFQPASGSAGH